MIHLLKNCLFSRCRNFWLRLHHFFCTWYKLSSAEEEFQSFVKIAIFTFFSRRTSPDDAQNLCCRHRRKFYTWYNRRMQQLEKLQRLEQRVHNAYQYYRDFIGWQFTTFINSTGFEVQYKKAKSKKKRNGAKNTHYSFYLVLYFKNISKNPHYSFYLVL